MDAAAQYPIRIIESGPAAGALAAAYYSGLPGSIDPNVIAFDMGGTTAKICLVEAGRPRLSTVFEADRIYRFKRGSGLPVKVPVIDMIEIGAGGGSIAQVDAMGLLKVGPASAGADPGPACYGLGGEQPTVTDANVVLGYLNPDYFLGGAMQLDREAASRAFSDRLCKALGKGVTDAAIGVFEVVCENMAGAAKVHLAERGSDPRRFSLVAFGGAGPIHAYRVAQLLRVRRVVYPLGAGTFSAFGMLVSPLAFDFVRTYVAKGGQVQFGRVLKGTPIEVINWRVIVSGPGPTFSIADLARSDEPQGMPGQASNGSVKGARDVYFHEPRGFVNTVVYERRLLRRGAVILGPAVIEETNSTIVVGPRATGLVDDNYSVVIELQ